MLNILVIGAKGQLGSEIHKLSSSFADFLFVFTDSDTLDITNSTALNVFFETQKFQFVINCAAYTAVDKAESEPERAEKINSQAVKYLSDVTQKYQCKLIHISTDYVFDGNVKNAPFIETDTVNPLSVYGKSKLHGELQLLHHQNCLIIRTSWLYSSFGNNFMKTMLKLGAERESLNVVFDQVGTPTYAEDLAFAILQIIEKTKGNEAFFQSEIYHFSNEGVCSWYDFAEEIMQMAKLNCKVFPIESSLYPTAAKRPAYSVLNKSKIKQVFGLTIPHWRISAKKCFREIKNKDLC